MTRWGSRIAAAGFLGAALVLPSNAADGAPSNEQAVSAVIDDWHDAAAAADEDRYFGHMMDNAVFIGTDAAERWTKAQFRAYAHPYFAKGKAWSFRSVRRVVTFSADGAVAWFDENLATPNLGPCRGSGVLVLDRTGWKIAQYNLSVPIPNDVFDQVKKIIAAASAAKP